MSTVSPKNVTETMACLCVWWQVQGQLMEYAVELLGDVLLEGYSRVKRCTNEGRALMSLDLQASAGFRESLLFRDMRLCTLASFLGLCHCSFRAKWSIPRCSRVGLLLRNIPCASSPCSIPGHALLCRACVLLCVSGAHQWAPAADGEEA